MSQGIGSNTGIYDYQFGAPTNTPFCGMDMTPNPDAAASGAMIAPAACGQCPAIQQTCATLHVDTGACNYGFTRYPDAPFAPSGGGRFSGYRMG